jgi:ABC-type multidrug transport system ATPase subunit
MTDSSAPIIRTIDLTKQYKNLTAVDVLSFEVRRGEVFGFLGPNGAGKTTTIGMLLGLVRPSAGDAEVLGVSIRHNLHTALRRVGAIIENPAFYLYLTGSDNLRTMRKGVFLSCWSLSVCQAVGRAKSALIRLACASGWGSPAPYSGIPNC